MKIVYLSYWSLSEGLTQSSVIPHLQILSDKSYIDQILFFTIERAGDQKVPEISVPKAQHVALYSENLKIGLINKMNDFRIFTKQILQELTGENYTKIVCRGALAGSLGYLVNRKTGIPYVVESFEPHADYMLDGKVWSRWGFKYLFQKYWEQRIMKTAEAVVTVSRFYASKISTATTGKVFTFGCAVDLERFKYSDEKRQSIRQELNIQPEETVGIYVGKFGSIYCDSEAFRIFKCAFDQIPGFRLIILTPEKKEWVYNRLLEFAVDSSRCFVDRVPYDQVVNYLCASDFAFSMVRPSPVRLYCSPIKDGEYWANGLYVLSADSIGEDSEIILKEGAGAIFKEDLSDISSAIDKILALSKKDRQTGVPRKVAEKYRAFEDLHHLYDQIIKK